MAPEVIRAGLEMKAYKKKLQEYKNKKNKGKGKAAAAA